jgi:hypothetical protein
MCNEFLWHHEAFGAYSTRRNINNCVLNTALGKGKLDAH